jgi:hypothetical protein
LFSLYIDFDLDGQFNYFLNCGTPQFFGDPTFEILNVEANLFVPPNPFASHVHHVN